jgi:hypothetical protein
MRATIPSLLLALASAASVANAAPTQSIAWQWLGEFHGEETLARDGETWLALRSDARHAWLESVVVRVEAVNDPILDADDERSGRRVSTPSLSHEPLALLKGAGIVPGALASPQHDPVMLVPGVWRRVETRAIPGIALLLDCDAEAPDPDASFRCTLKVRDDVLEQSLHTFAATKTADGSIMLGDEGNAELRFAGDLDRDGRMDLVLDLRDHYNVQRTEVWLSSDAEAGDLVRLAFRGEITGC